MNKPYVWGVQSNSSITQAMGYLKGESAIPVSSVQHQSRQMYLFQQMYIYKFYLIGSNSITGLL